MANSKKRCKECSEWFAAETMLTTPKGVFCSYDHAAKWAEKKREQLREKSKKKDEEYNKEFRTRAPKNTRQLNKSDLKWQEDKTQTAFNRMRVQQELLWFYERGIEPYCISCQKTKMDFCCGHNKTRGSNSYLQFDERNTFLQCNKACNSSLSGNINGNSSSIGYLAGLKQRFGEEEGQAIIDYCDNAPTVSKRTVEDFESLRKSFNAEFRRLKPIVEKENPA